MATYIKTLKEDNGDITYPQTKAGAVLLNNGSDLETELTNYVTAEDIASTADVSHPITTSLIADSAVTTAKIADGSLTHSKFVTEDVTSTTSITVVSGNIRPTVNKAYRMGNMYFIAINFTASANITVAAHGTSDIGVIKIAGETIVGGAITTVNSTRFMVGVVQPGGTYNDSMMLRLYNMTASSATISSGGGLGTATAWFIVA